MTSDELSIAAIGRSYLRPTYLHFTDRQLRILYMAAEGLTEVAMARRLEVKVKDIKMASRAMRSKFGAKNLAGMVGIAYRERIII